MNGRKKQNIGILFQTLIEQSVITYKGNRTSTVDFFRKLSFCCALSLRSFD